MVHSDKLICQNSDNTYLSYIGTMTQSVLSSFIDVLETLEKCHGVKFPHKLYMIFIETAQNLMQYSSHSEEIYKIYLSIGKNQDQLYILTQNLIDKEHKKKLEERLNSISQLDRDTIKEIYRQKLKSGEDKHEHGAGLGLLYIARHSSKIEFEIVEIVDEKYLFTLMIYI